VTAAHGPLLALPARRGWHRAFKLKFRPGRPARARVHGACAERGEARSKLKVKRGLAQGALAGACRLCARRRARPAARGVTVTPGRPGPGQPQVSAGPSQSH
jgi:hypothetical protein